MKVEERRERLVAAAFDVIARDGVAAATTRAICAEAAMPQGSFHYAFRSKDELLKELSRTMLGAQTADLFDLDEPPDTLEATIQLLIRRVFDIATENGDRQAVLTELMVLDLRAGDNPGALNRWQFQLYTEIATQLLLSVGNRFGVGWSVPVDALARMIAVAMSGTTLAWLGDRDGALARRSLVALEKSIHAMAQPKD